MHIPLLVFTHKANSLLKNGEGILGSHNIMYILAMDQGGLVCSPLSELVACDSFEGSPWVFHRYVLLFFFLGVSFKRNYLLNPHKRSSNL